MLNKTDRLNENQIDGKEQLMREVLVTPTYDHCYGSNFQSILYYL